MKKRVNFYFNREYKIKVLLSLFNGFKHTKQNNYILEMDGWYSIYNLLRMRKLFNLPFNKSIMLEKYLYKQKLSYMYYLEYCMVVYKDKAFKLLVDKKIQSHPVKKQTTSV